MRVNSHNGLSLIRYYLVKSIVLDLFLGWQEINQVRKCHKLRLVILGINYEYVNYGVRLLPFHP